MLSTSVKYMTSGERNPITTITHSWRVYNCANSIWVGYLNWAWAMHSLGKIKHALHDDVLSLAGAKKDEEFGVT